MKKWGGKEVGRWEDGKRKKWGGKEVGRWGRFN